MAGEFVAKNGIRIPVGSVGSPSLSFLGDTNTGIYHSAALTLSFSSGGFSRGSIGDSIDFTPKGGNNFTVTTTGAGQITMTAEDLITIDSTNVGLTGFVYIHADAEIDVITADVVMTGSNSVSITGTGGATLSTTNAQLLIYSGTGILEISTDVAATSVSIASSAAVKTVLIGSVNGASTSTFRSGTGGTNVTSTGAFTISGALGSTLYTTNANLIIYSGTGRLYIGDDSAANTMKFGTGAAVKNVTVGSVDTTSITTVQSGTAGTIITSTGFFTLTSSGATDCNIYTSGGAKINIYSGTGSLNISADAAATSVNLATGAGVKNTTVGSTNTTSSLTLQGGGSGITVTSPGNISFTSSTYAGVSAKISMVSDVGGWIKHNNTYFVPAGGTALQTLLQAIIATTETPGTIVLGYGTHTINWTVATTVNQEVTIIGSGATINFSSTDADCCLIFSSRCILRDIYFTGPNPGWLAPQMVRVQGAFSEIVGCNFNGAPNSGTSYLLYVDAANVLVDQCQFTAAAVAGAAAVDDSIYLSANSYRSKVLHSYFTCDYCQVGPIILAASTLSVVIDACDFYCANVLGLARITLEAGTSNCVISNCNWKITAASAGRVILFTASDTGGAHLITHNNIAEAASATTTRASCIWVAQPNCRFDSNVITTANRVHGGTPDVNRDRAAIYILAHHCSIIGNLFDLSGSAQEAIVVLNTGNVAVNAAMEGVFISNNYFYNIDGVTATGGYGVWVYSTAAFRPANGVVDTNKFHASGNVSNCIGCAAANGAINWTAVGNGRRIIGAFTVGDWVSGGAQMIASNQ